MEPEDIKCPDCGHLEFFLGPRGGSSVNVQCAKCSHTFNWMGPFGMQPIPEVEGVYNREHARPLHTFISSTQALISLGLRIEELERELEMHQRGMQGANQVVAETKNRLVEAHREIAECRRMIAMDTATVNSQVALLDQKNARIAELEKAAQTFDGEAAVAAGWHSASFIQMFMGYMTGKLHLEHIGEQAMLDCFAEFEDMMEKRRDSS